jgi:transposase
MVSEMIIETTTEKLISILEEQLTFMKQQNDELSKKLDDSLAQNKYLSEQVRQLTKMIYGSRSEKSKYQAPDGQCSLFDDDPSFNNSEQTEEQSTETVSYTVTRPTKKKKRNDSFMEGVEVEEIHYHPQNLQCACCQTQLHEIGSTIAREEANFIPAKLVRVQHIEHAYECKQCKKDTHQNASIKRGKAPAAVIPRSLAGPTVLAKLIYDKFVQYLPLYRQVKEWERAGLLTNDKNLSNWVIRAAEEWLLPIYEQMKNVLSSRSLLHIDETYAQVLNRSDGKSAQSNAYNWVFRTVPYQGPVIIVFQHALSRSRAVLEEFLTDFKGTVICDGYSAYDKLPNVTFANCWAHVRRYWLKVDSKNGRMGLAYCNRLYALEQKFKGLPPKQRQKMRWRYARKIVRKFFGWLERSPFFGKNALATATEYTLNRKEELKAFLYNGQIEIDNNPAENAIRPTVIGRKNWLFSVSEAGAKANAICLSLAETAKANGVDFYQYLVKLLTDLPNLPIHQQPELLQEYMPWSKSIQATCVK